MRRSLLLAAGLLACLPAFPVLADYPDKPSRWSCRSRPAAPPTRSRVTSPRRCASRWAAPSSSTTWPVPAARWGANKVAKAAPDGYTLLLHHIGIASAPSLYRTLPYKTLDDFEYLGMVNEVPMTVIGRANLPANNFAELSKWLEANKDKVNLAHAGVGSASHLCGLLFQSALKLNMTTVPYKGTAPAMNDLLGGQVDVMCDQTTNTTGQIESGKVKAYAVTTPRRLPNGPLAKLPTADESGLKGFNVSVWHGVYAPKGTPKAVVDKVNAALRVALNDADFHKRQEALGAVIITDARTTPAEHKKFVEAEINKLGPVIKAAGQYAD